MSDLTKEEREAEAELPERVRHGVDGGLPAAIRFLVEEARHQARTAQTWSRRLDASRIAHRGATQAACDLAKERDEATAEIERLKRAFLPVCEACGEPIEHEGIHNFALDRHWHAHCETLIEQSTNDDVVLPWESE